MVNFTSEKIPYRQTRSFSRIVLDYLDQAEDLRPFYTHAPNLEGIKAAIEERGAKPFDRTKLTGVLAKQYSNMQVSGKLRQNLENLADDDCFTITTAHQPNIFTGHLYFIYKIIHAIRLAEDLNAAIPGNRFVPVFYMGSEDADLEELGTIDVNGKKYQWKTNQTGAVGRMKVDKPLLEMLEEIGKQLEVEPHGHELMELLSAMYTPGKSIEQATFEFVHYLFNDHGLVILLPDNPVLKKQFNPIVLRELNEQFAYPLVQSSIEKFPSHYKVQAAGRELNLFYLTDDSRQRIEKSNGTWQVLNSNTKFSDADIRQELENNPDRFSPNVILRPLYQELILPDIAFIGGGGELAYWLELRSLFNETGIPFPVLILRNSFAIIPSSIDALITKNQLQTTDLFEPELAINNKLTKLHSKQRLELSDEKQKLRKLYNEISQVAASIDLTLDKHVASLLQSASKKIEALEKKMLKAERKKFEASARQVNKIKKALFPGGTLQERVDNLLPYYARWGKAFIGELFTHSGGLDQQFTLLREQAGDQ
jgi:bacillithiol synthase